MRFATGLMISCFLAGCAGAPPKPPSFKGEYRPINKTVGVFSQPKFSSASTLTRGIA